MTIDNFIETVWSAKLLKNWNDFHVFPKTCNRDYEGELKGMGDSVKINSIGRITIATYTKNAPINAPEVLDDSTLTLVIDQGDYFNFEVDDVDKAQQKPKVMSEAMSEAAWGLADTVDNFIATTIAAGVQTANIMTAQSIGTGAADDDAYELLVDLDTLLTVNNAPPGGRWAVVPPWFHGALRKDNRFVSFGTEQSNKRLRGAPIGEAGGFTLYQSNNVPLSGSAYNILCGVEASTAFVEQINKIEPFRPQNRFSDAVKGLMIYGAKVLRPYGLASCQVTEA